MHNSGVSPQENPGVWCHWVCYSSYLQPPITSTTNNNNRSNLYRTAKEVCLQFIHSFHLVCDVIANSTDWNIKVRSVLSHFNLKSNTPQHTVLITQLTLVPDQGHLTPKYYRATKNTTTFINGHAWELSMQRGPERVYPDKQCLKMSC
jgi:hypothetical protein